MKKQPLNATRPAIKGHVDIRNMSLNEFYLSIGIQLLHSVVRIPMPDHLYKMFENFMAII